MYLWVANPVVLAQIISKHRSHRGKVEKLSSAILSLCVFFPCCVHQQLWPRDLPPSSFVSGIIFVSQYFSLVYFFMFCILLEFYGFLHVLCDFPSCRLWRFFIFWCVITFGRSPWSAAARCRSSLNLVLSLHLKWTHWQDEPHDKPLQWCGNKQTQTETRGGRMNWIPGFISPQTQTHPCNETPRGGKVQTGLCQKAVIYSNMRRRNVENAFTWHLVNINRRKVSKASLVNSPCRSRSRLNLSSKPVVLFRERGTTGEKAPR